MASFQSLQDKYASSSAIERLGAAKENFAKVGNLPLAGQFLIEAAEVFINAAQENLNKSGSISTGAISDGLSRGALEYTSTSVAISVGYLNNAKAGSYYDYVNKGVKGLKSGKPADSPYAFRYLGVSPKMASALKGWIRQNRLAARNESQTSNLSRLQIKRKRIVQMSQDQKLNALAYAVSRSIKKAGIKKTAFFDKAVETAFGEDFRNAIAEVIAADITVLIKQANRQGNG